MISHERLLKSTFLAQSEQLREIRQCLQDTFETQDCPKSYADRWVLAINEACMNIIQHAYGADTNGEIIIEVWRSGHEWIFRLTDFAKPVDKTKVCARDLDDIRPGGLGVHFIQEVMDEVEFLDSGAVEKRTIGKTTGNILQMKSKIDDI